MHWNLSQYFATLLCVNKKKDEFLEQLKKIPIVQVSCEKVGLSRNTIYRWRKEDTAFSIAMDQALQEGEDLVNDMSESQLLSMIKEKEWPAISFWLRHRNSRFRDKLEVTTVIKQDELLPDEEVTVRHALSLSATNVDFIKPNQDTNNEQPTNTGGDHHTNDQEPKSENGDNQG